MWRSFWARKGQARGGIQLLPYNRLTNTRTHNSPHSDHYTHCGIQWLHSDVSPGLFRGALHPKQESWTCTAKCVCAQEHCVWVRVCLHVCIYIYVCVRACVYLAGGRGKQASLLVLCDSDQSQEASPKWWSNRMTILSYNDFDASGGAACVVCCL